MNVIRFNEPQFESRLRALAATSSLFDPAVEQCARRVIDGIVARGDEAVVDFTAEFDHFRLSAAQLAITKAELMVASLRADAGLRDALKLAAENVEAFARRSRRKNWSARNAQGARVGEKFDPLQRVGIYIPGGTAPLASTAVMTIVLARAAGCREIVVCTPCGRDGSIHPALLLAARTLGATEIYRIGGAQAIAAMACGTKTIRRVQKIFGPGNAYVVAAKRLLFGRVAIDLLPGPSEVLVLADDTANPRFVAADLLAQAEHGSGHERVWLITTSAKILSGVQKELERQLPTLSRRAAIENVLKHHTALVLAKDLDSAVAWVNEIAPEHCEVMTRRPTVVARRIVTAGAIFLGNYSPTVLGDYVAGPSHVLPTGGAGASFAGLTVDQFQRRTSVVEYTPAALRRSLPAVAKFGEVEGLDAHARSAAIRLRERK